MQQPADHCGYLDMAGGCGAYLLHVGLLGEGDPGDGVGCNAQLLPVHLAFLHLHDACGGDGKLPL